MSVSKRGHLQHRFASIGQVTKHRRMWNIAWATEWQSKENTQSNIQTPVELTCSANKIHIEISRDDRRRQLPEEQFKHPSYHVYTVLI